MLPIEKQLFEAIQKNDETQVRTLLDNIKKGNDKLQQTEILKRFKPASLEARDENGYTPLIKAIDKGYAGIVQALLENGAQVDNPSKTGATPITYAIDGHKDCVLLLIKAKANLNAKGLSDKTPLMWATVRRQFDCVQVLLEHKVELNNRDMDGYTALILASQIEIPDCAAALLLAGADPTIKDNMGLTAAQHALNGKNSECFDMLTDSNYFKSPEKKLFTAIRLNDIPLLKDAITEINEINEVIKKDPSMADMIDHIPSINARIRLNTPLILAAKENRIECLKLLIDNKADLNINLDGTALVWSAFNKHYDCTKLLLATDGVDCNAKDDGDRTALRLAVEVGFEAGVKLLSESKGIDHNAINKNDCTALMHAVSKGQESATKILLEQKGIDINAKNARGLTALICAVKNNRESCAKLLLEEKGINLDAQDDCGNTALHYAARDYNAKLFELLMVYGANTMLRNYTGRFASDYGCSEVLVAVKNREVLHSPINVVDRTPDTLAIPHQCIADSKPATAWPRLNSIWSLLNPNKSKPKKHIYTQLPISEPSEQELSTFKTSSPKNGRGS